jgi:hypothetical protein
MYDLDISFEISLSPVVVCRISLQCLFTRQALAIDSISRYRLQVLILTSRGRFERPWQSRYTAETQSCNEKWGEVFTIDDTQRLPIFMSQVP